MAGNAIKFIKLGYRKKMRHHIILNCCHSSGSMASLMIHEALSDSIAWPPLFLPHQNESCVFYHGMATLFCHHVVKMHHQQLNTNVQFTFSLFLMTKPLTNKFVIYTVFITAKRKPSPTIFNSA